MATLTHIQKGSPLPKSIDALLGPAPESVSNSDFERLLDRRKEASAPKDSIKETREKPKEEEEKSDSEDAPKPESILHFVPVGLLTVPLPAPTPIVPAKPAEAQTGETDSLLVTPSKPTFKTEVPTLGVAQPQQSAPKSPAPALHLAGWAVVSPQKLPLTTLQDMQELMNTNTDAPMGTQPLADIMSIRSTATTSIFAENLFMREMPNAQESTLPSLPLVSTSTGIEAVRSPESRSFSDAQERREQREESLTEPNGVTIKPTAEKAGLSTDSFSLVEQRRIAEKPSQVLGSDSPHSALVDRTEIVQQVTKHLENMRLQQGKGEMAFQLRPDHLGEIRVHITSNSEGVVARILTDNHPVQEALQSAKESLRHSLEQRGLNLVRFDVGLNSGGMMERQFTSPNPHNFHSTRATGRTNTRSIRSQGVAEAGQWTGNALRSAWRESLSRLDYSA